MATEVSPASPLSGSGSPEGSVSATVGTLYVRTSDGKVWAKKSGSGNTGWTEQGGGAGSGDMSKSTYDPDDDGKVASAVAADTVGGSTVAQIVAASVAAAYPVGSIYISVNSTNPATSLGFGTWSAFGAGRVPVGFDSGDTDFDADEETGGAKAVASSGANANESAHTHAYTQVPNHTHIIAAGQGSHQHGMQEGQTDGAGNLADRSNAASAATMVTDLATLPQMVTDNPTGGVASGTTQGGSAHTHTFTGAATSVVQPYIVVRMWKRTA